MTTVLRDCDVVGYTAQSGNLFLPPAVTPGSAPGVTWSGWGPLTAGGSDDLTFMLNNGDTSSGTSALREDSSYTSTHLFTTIAISFTIGQSTQGISSDSNPYYGQYSQATMVQFGGQVFYMVNPDPYTVVLHDQSRRLANAGDTSSVQYQYVYPIGSYNQYVVLVGPFTTPLLKMWTADSTAPQRARTGLYGPVAMQSGYDPPGGGGALASYSSITSSVGGIRSHFQDGQ